MPVDNSTVVVSTFKTGTNWTIDVSSCNLSASLAVKDFDPYINGGISLLSNWTKTSQVLLTYTGASLPASTPITIVRKTPITRLQELGYGGRLNTANYEGELNSIHKVLYDLKVQPPVLLSPSIVDYTTYNKPIWSGNVLQAPTARAVSVAIDAAIAASALPTNLNIAGTLGVGGNSTLTGAVSVGNTFSVASTSQFAGTVNVTSGNLVVGAGNLSVTGTGAFTGAVGTGNLTVTGTLGTSGLATLNSATVTNASTFTGAATFNNATNTLTNAPAQLTAGSTEMVNALWVRRGVRPYVRALASGTGQTFAHNVGAILALNVENSDIDNAFASNTFTVPTGCGGLYFIDVSINFASTVSFGNINIRVNGADVRSSSTSNDGVDKWGGVQRQAVVNLAAGDTVSVFVIQLNATSSGKGVAGGEMSVVRMGNL